jgi:AcrR family transcriptional regulator
VTGRINRAALDLLIEGGANACTFSNVAERAGIERSTLYRRYPTKWEMMLEAFLEHSGADVIPILGSSFAEDLKSVLQRLATTLQSSLGRAFMALAAELSATPSRDLAQAYFARRMTQLGPMFSAAIVRGEISPTTDREFMFGFAAGAVYFRVFIASKPVDDAFIDSVVECVCRLFCSQAVSGDAPLKRPPQPR